MPSLFRRGVVNGGLAARIPGVGALARLFGSIASFRLGRLPVGLLALLPVALLLDLFDAADELALPPVGMALSFVLESAFVLGVTGRSSYALGFAAIDLIPIVDVVPFATLTVLKAALDAWNEGEEAREDGPARPKGPVIDV